MISHLKSHLRRLHGIAKETTIVEMLERYPLIFDEMYIALADAGEQAGLLAEVLGNNSVRNIV